jgi:beta-lactamase regulating signal transducer with metallopeptidase domain
MDAAARLLLTYLLHSTVLLGVAWIACRALAERRLALQEAILRAALVGGLATASLQVGLGLVPLGGALRLPSPVGHEDAAAGPTLAADLARAVPPAPVTARLSSPSRPRAVAPAVGPSASAGEWPTRIVIVPAEPTWAERVMPAASGFVALHWREALVLGWLLLGGVAFARLLVAARRLARILRDRTAVSSSPLAPLADALGESLGLRPPVRISTAPRLAVPLATGVLRPEVCLPARAVIELEADAQLALCAHELAHVARRDPAWVLAARVVESLVPLQPLNTWARRRLQDVAVCLSDDLAVSVSARPLGLARTLVDVASWTLDDPALLPAAAAGALSARSRLGLRVERLMDPVRRLERPGRSHLPAAAAVVLATALVTPVVSGSATAPPGPPAPPVAAVAPVPPPTRPVTPAAPAPAPRSVSAVRPAPAPVPEAPPVPPTPAAAPAPEALAAPAAPPAPPAPADRPSSRDAEARLEELTRRISERAQVNEADMQKLEREIEAAAARFHPDDAEMRRLSEEMARTAQQLADAAAAQAREGSQSQGATADSAREAARRMAELREELRRQAQAYRIPADQVRELSEKARALADASRPTPAELAELRRLSRELARESTPRVEDLVRMAHDEAARARSQAQAASEVTRDAMQRAAEELRRAMDEMRRAMEEMRLEPRKPEGAPEAKPVTPRP